ncbi:MAG: molybdopterin-dependent oxidoreductase [Anaerolineae bacterium]
MNITRRNFLKTSAVVGGSTVVASQIDRVFDRMGEMAHKASADEPYPLNNPENIIYSACLQCHTSCTIKAKVLDGVMVKIDGNAYSPMNMLPHLDYETDPAEAAAVDAKLCPKGQAGVQSQYDPYRITQVLKRTGPRGSNQWEVISFEQAIDEIVNGGTFADGTTTPGLKEIWGVRDPELMAELKADAGAVVSGEMTIEAFKEKHADHLDLLIDPDLPDLGPINNQFLFVAGRIEHGRKEFAKRWLKDAFGSVNWWEHTTICEQSHHIAYEQMTNQYSEGKWSGGKTHMKPDFANSEFVIFFGTGAFEANFGPTPLAELVTDAIVAGDLEIAVVDPRLSKTASKARWWLPVKPGTDAALALAMIGWIIENERYDARYLMNANKAAANADGEMTWSNAAYLVKLDDDGNPTTLLRAADIGLAVPEGGDPAHYFVVSHEGELLAVDPYDTENPVEGDLFAEGTVEGVAYKSALLLVQEVAGEHSLEEWADICGIPTRKIVEVAREFTAHGKAAAAELYRGPVQHTNGYYNAQAIITLNVLIGNGDWTGGLTAGGSHWHEMGDKAHTPFDLLSSSTHPGKLGSFGVMLTREKLAYEKTLLYKRDGYPARRPFFPYSSNVYQEIIPSAGDGYPYAIKAMFLHKGTPVFATPAGNPAIEILRDMEKVPLLFSCDIVIAETSMYSDYLFPDTAIWERWGTPHTTPGVLTKVSKVRQPIVNPLVETVTVFGQEQPLGMEAIMLGIAEKLGLPGYGPNGLGEGFDFKAAEDWFLKEVANIAFGDKDDGSDAVPEASDAELEIFRNARRHMNSTVFDEERWRRSIGDDDVLFRRMVTVLNRGGRFENHAKRHKNGDYVGHPWGNMFSIYVENVAKGRHPYTGEPFSGLPKFDVTRDYSDTPINDDGYDLALITYKEITGGQSRTAGNYWLQHSILPQNFVYLNRQTAEEKGLADGDRVRVVSASNPDGVWRLGDTERPVVGTVRVVEGLRPGTVAVSWHYGHWAYGAGDVTINGVVVPGDERRAGGVCTNAVLREDPTLGNVCLQDLIGASASFYDTMVRLEKV